MRQDMTGTLLAGLLLTGCIPHVMEPGYGETPPPPRQGPPPSQWSSQDSAQTPPRQSPGGWQDDRPGPSGTNSVWSDDKPTYSNEPPRPIGDGVTALPAPKPAWEARPVVADAQYVEAGSYTVQPGDTLRGIGNRSGAGSEAIALANNLDAPYTVRAGQVLSIPAGRYHLVREGQTGIAIARAYDLEWSKIIAANALTEPYVLRVGQRVLIPSSMPLTAEQRAASFRLNIDDIITGGEPAIAQTAKPAKAVSTPERVLPPSAVVVAPTHFAGGFSWPVRGQIIRRFGTGATGEKNNGVKIAAPIGTPILAAADGVVAYVGDGVAGLGGLVILRHGQNMTTVYGHASQLLVQRGQSVKKGQTIALSGNSGFADRPEVHFEIRQGRTPVDPLTRLPSN